jgi:tetratricopeptide (TPR) repeat protein
MKINQNNLIKRAEKQFAAGDFDQSLQSFALILAGSPEHTEAKVGVLLSDFGSENAEEAQALYDYYQVIKGEKEDAYGIIDNIITTLEESKNSLQDLLIDPLKEHIDYEDGIRYEDFMQLVDDRGDFKQAFEDIMFSTKVIITEKSEFIDFVKHLATEGFDEMALHYLDAAVGSFGDDQDIYELYTIATGNKK